MSDGFIGVLLLLLMLVAVVLIFGLSLPKAKGLIGEMTVSSILSLLNGDEYKIINNVVLNTQGRTAQIDHLVIGDFGIFVIETKNYKGWIFGNENSEYWTQVLYKRKEKLYNPIRQNFGHILALKNSLREYPHIKYVSVIVFFSKATIRVNTITAVTYAAKLPEFIRKHKEVHLTKSEKEEIVEKINAINARDKYDKRAHIELIKQRVKNKERSIRQKKCPQCGRDLVLRKGKFGEFLGCSSFPACKFTCNT
jgi:Nuclease-related domain/Topoisomerase DNA binding C4 zinc finger